LEKQFFAQNNVRGHIEKLQLDGMTATNIPINMSVNAKAHTPAKTFPAPSARASFSAIGCFSTMLASE
jgi:hypothetical protein